MLRSRDIVAGPVALGQGVHDADPGVGEDGRHGHGLALRGLADRDVGVGLQVGGPGRAS